MAYGKHSDSMTCISKTTPGKFQGCSDSPFQQFLKVCVAAAKYIPSASDIAMYRNQLFFGSTWN
jgi:hypothetical protein